MKFVDGINIPEREIFRQSVEAELKDLGIKLTREREEKQSLKTLTGTLFGNYLSNLPLSIVQQDDMTLEVPTFLVKSFEFIGANIHAEGLFRKAGSVQRQRELKKCLENNGNIQNCDVHDVANLIKQFLRLLPSPLIHCRLHDPLLKAFESGNSMSIFLLCALMQFVHLHTLRYVMTFFSRVSQSSEFTKMNSHNLAVVLTPNIFNNCKNDSKLQKDKGKILQKETALIEWFIEHSQQIGLVPDHLFGSGFRSFLFNDVPLTTSKSKRAKKRNSLNGVISEIRRRVHPRSRPVVTEHGQIFEDTAELIPLSTYKQYTPSIYKTTKSNSSPSIAVKRKSNDSSSCQSEIPKKSPRCENVCAVMHHMDSPTPVLDETTVSIAPQIETGVEFKNEHKEQHRGFGGKMKMFGKNYLKRRNSLDHMAKQGISAVEKKKTHETTLVHRVEKRINGEKKSFMSSPSLPNILLPTNHPTKVRSSPRLELLANLKYSASKLKNEAKKSTQSRNINLKQRKASDQQLFRSDNDIYIPSKTTTKRKLSIKRSFSEGDEVRQNQDKLESNLEKIKAEVAEGKKLTSENNDDRDFTKPIIALNRSLRRGRPNTVNTGLPVESPFKPPKPEMEFDFVVATTPAPVADVKTPATSSINVDSEISPMICSVKQALNFDEESLNVNLNDELVHVEKPLIKSDSGIFSEFEEVKETNSSVDYVVVDMGEEEEDDIKEVKPKFSIDSGIDQSPPIIETENVPENNRLRRKSVSLSNIEESVKSLNERTRSEEHVDDSSDDIQWESANSFVSRELRQENTMRIQLPSSGLGRPSIIQLLKEKAGTVTATAKQYDAISINGNSPRLNSSAALSTNGSCSRVNGLKLNDKTPVKINGVFSTQGTPLRSKNNFIVSTPCADRTNHFDPVFKTPQMLLRSATSRCKENSPKVRRIACGMTKERGKIVNSSGGGGSTRRSNSFEKCSGKSLRKSPRLQTVENRSVRRRLSSTRRKSSSSTNGSAI